MNDSINPRLRAGEIEMKCPRSVSEAKQKGANSSLYHLLLQLVPQWIG
jgi:hypothetical protein